MRRITGGSSSSTRQAIGCAKYADAPVVVAKPLTSGGGVLKFDTGLAESLRTKGPLLIPLEHSKLSWALRLYQNPVLHKDPDHLARPPCRSGSRPSVALQPNSEVFQVISSPAPYS